MQVAGLWKVPKMLKFLSFICGIGRRDDKQEKPRKSGDLIQKFMPQNRNTL
jgi:hypothetical protein